MTGALRYADVPKENLDDWLRNLVVGAAELVEKMSDQFDVDTKESFDGSTEVVTSADKRSHRFLLDELESFPGLGCVSEEEKLRVPCSFPDADVYITFDEMDGSSAYSRGFLFGITVMLALVENGVVVAAYIADVRSRRVVGYGPRSTEVTLWRDFDFGRVSALPAHIERPAELKDLLVLLRDERASYEPGIAAIAQSVERGGVFKRYVASDSGVSIGSSVTQLLLGQVDVLVMRGKRRWSPWDDTPWIGLLCLKLGFVCLCVSTDGTRLVEIDPPLVQKETPRGYEIILVHPDHAAQLREAFAKKAVQGS